MGMAWKWAEPISLKKVQSGKYRFKINKRLGISFLIKIWKTRQNGLRPLLQKIECFLTISHSLFFQYREGKAKSCCKNCKKRRGLEMGGAYLSKKFEKKKQKSRDFQVPIIECWAKKILGLSVLVCRKIYGDDYLKIEISEFFLGFLKKGTSGYLFIQTDNSTVRRTGLHRNPLWKVSLFLWISQFRTLFSWVSIERGCRKRVLCCFVIFLCFAPVLHPLLFIFW